MKCLLFRDGSAQAPVQLQLSTDREVVERLKLSRHDPVVGKGFVLDSACSLMRCSRILSPELPLYRRLQCSLNSRKYLTGVERLELRGLLLVVVEQGLRRTMLSPICGLHYRQWVDYLSFHVGLVDLGLSCTQQLELEQLVLELED